MLLSKRPLSEQPAAAMAMSETAAILSQTREETDTIERGMWLLTHTLQTQELNKHAASKQAFKVYKCSKSASESG